MTGVRASSDSGERNGDWDYGRDGEESHKGARDDSGKWFDSCGRKGEVQGLRRQNPEVMVISARHTMAPGLGFRTQLEFKGDGAPE